MAIVEMKKVFLFVHRTEKEEVVRALQSLGLVEIRQVQENPAWEEWQGYLTGDGDPERSTSWKTVSVRSSMPSISSPGISPLRRALSSSLPGLKSR